MEQQQQPMAGARRPGDWDCPNCGAMCFGSRVQCFKCGTMRAQGGFQQQGYPQQGYQQYPQQGYQQGYQQQGFGYGGPQRRPGDWNCMGCGAHNFASRTACYKCGAEKPQNAGMQRQYIFRDGDWKCPQCPVR
eukprot:GABW01000863.1.p1 GENE.GABW01000863.1~~GABW01000863.1.p1  ORF type:complete len:133 (+),score=46.33 GABW01000863.1:27-425(+)